MHVRHFTRILLGMIYWKYKCLNH